MTSYEAYQLFLALKQHFTSPSYDFFKYNGKVRTSVDSFEKRKDVYIFRKLAALDDPKTRIVASLASEITWINDVVGAAGKKAESDYQKTVQTFSYAFKSFLDGIHKTLPELLKKQGNSYPYLAELLFEEKVPLQFVIVLDDLLQFLPKWDDEFEDILWKPFRQRLAKLRPFYVYEKAKAKQIFLVWAQANT